MDLEAASFYLQKKMSPAAVQRLVFTHATLSQDRGSWGKGKKGRERELIAGCGRRLGEQAGEVSMNERKLDKSRVGEAGSPLGQSPCLDCVSSTGPAQSGCLSPLA